MLSDKLPDWCAVGKKIQNVVYKHLPPYTIKNIDLQATRQIEFSCGGWAIYEQIINGTYQPVAIQTCKYCSD